MEVRTEPTAEAAADRAARWVARRLRAAVEARGMATVAFSGGATPSRMLATLGRSDLDWAKITVFQVDERVAPDDSPERNANLLELLPLPSRQIALMGVTAKDLAAASKRYASRLPDRFDVVHLGIGDDGHTASWPPGDPVIGSRRSVDLSAEFQGRVRMTLTPVAVNAARSRLVLVAGSAKADAVARWLGGDTELPIATVRRTRTTVILDAEAASAIA